IFPALDEEKQIVIDFEGVISSPHSFLSALLASPIKSIGMNAYKKIKILNATPDIRETIDFILDDNT
ncbi:STAS-like domain-containing protein, partial [Pseudomonas aeruginosa]